MCCTGEKKEGPEVKPEAMEVDEVSEGAQKMKEEPAETTTPEPETKETPKEETASTSGKLNICSVNRTYSVCISYIFSQCKDIR